MSVVERRLDCMRSREADLEARLMPSRIPFASLAILAMATALLWTLCLPIVPQYVDEIDQLSDVFRPEWLVLATLLALPLKRAASWRCWVGLLGLVIACVMSLVITQEAVSRVGAAGLDLGGTESVWMPLAGCQVLVFVVATASGLRQRLFVRRWQRLDRKLARVRPVSNDRTAAS